LIVIENYLEQDQLRKIREEQYWQEPLAGRFIVKDFWNLASDQLMFHYFAQEMFVMGAKRNTLLDKALEISDGIEWWTHKFPNTYPNGSQRKGLDWHCDKDEGLFQAEGIILKPLAVAVLYVHEDIDLETMGKLEIKFGPGQQYTQEIDPKPNRCVIFDGSLEHRVTEGTNEVARRSLIANLWGMPIRNIRGKV